MVSSNVNHFGVLFIHHLQDGSKKRRVFFLPRTIFLQRPPINDIAIQDEAVTGMLLEEGCYLFGFGTGATQMKVRENDGPKMRLIFQGMSAW